MTPDTQSLITPDFSDVKDAVEPGVYNVRIVDSKVDQWEGKNGKPPTVYIAWTLETFNEAIDKNNGRKKTHSTPINGGGAFRLKDFYKAAMGEECKGAFDREMLHGKEIEVTIDWQKNRDGSQSEYTEVKTCKPIKAS